jgi:UDP-glucuronate 4-epimerase
LNAMRILLTGCAGFIGARVATMLLERGDEVVGVDTMNDYYDVRLKRHRLLDLERFPDFEFRLLDIEDKTALERVFTEHRFDAVISLAARAGVRASIAAPLIYVTTNIVGTLNLLELIAANNVPQFVVASSSSLYAGARPPFVETDDVTHPVSPYAATKLAAETLAKTWHHLHGINVAILRYFTIYGPAGRPDMSPFRFIECIRRGQPIQLYGDGTQTRDFTYIDDAAAGTVASLKIRGCEVVNLGGGNRPTSVNKMIATFEETLGRKAIVERLPANKADMPDTAAEISKAAALMDWCPRVDPLTGFSKTALWHEAQRAWLDRISL